MARPKSNPRDLGLIKAHLAESQAERFETLEFFRSLLQFSDVLDGVKKDDHFFAKIINLALYDYGIKQQDLAASINYSSAAILRWVRLDNLPRSDLRPWILTKIGDLLDQAIEIQRADETVPMGSCRRVRTSA